MRCSGRTGSRCARRHEGNSTFMMKSRCGKPTVGMREVMVGLSDSTDARWGRGVAEQGMAIVSRREEQGTIISVCSFYEISSGLGGLSTPRGRGRVMEWRAAERVRL